MATRHQSWISDEDVNGWHVVCEFTLDEESLDSPVFARISYSGAREDELRVIVPANGGAVPINHPFRNRLDIAGDIRIIRFSERVRSAQEGVWGHFNFGDQNQRIYFEGIMVAFADSGTPDTPVLPVDPVGPGAPEGLSSVTPQGVFPYLFLRKWSHRCAGACTCAYVRYGDAASPPAAPPVSTETLYSRLIALSPRTFAGAQQLVDLYLSGLLVTDFPALDRLSELGEPAARFHTVYQAIQQAQSATPDEIRGLILRQLDTNLETLSQYLASAGYFQATERCWQNYFALLIKMGCRPELLEQLAATLTGAWITATAFASNEELHLSGLRNAIVVLPAALFPLPAPVQSPPGCVGSGSVEVFAIGELQSIRHRVVRYQAGDLARVENVMGGEKIERSRRRLERSEHSNSGQTSEGKGRTDWSGAGSAQAFEKTLASVAADGLNVTANGLQVVYSPPNSASWSGGWGMQVAPGSPPSERDLQRAAYELVDTGRTEAARRVGAVREDRLLRETEEIDKSTIDNTSNNGNLVGVYRWLDRILRVQVFHCGIRLIVHFSITNPAAGFLEATTNQTGAASSCLIPPEAFQVHTPADINVDNYASLLARYGVSTGLEPPAARRIVSFVLRPGEAREASLPEGYQASTAYVTVAGSASEVAGVTGAIGRTGFSAGTPAGAAVQINLSGEEGTIAAALFAPEPLVTAQATWTARDTAAVIEVECQPSAECWNRWKAQVFEAIFDTYKANARRNPAAAGFRHNPELLRQMERREIRTRCANVLESIGTEQYVFSSPPSATDFALFDRPLVERMFDWQQMICWYPGEPCGYSPIAMDADSPEAGFARFLNARTVDVLVPAVPAYALAAVYYLRTGMIWTGAGPLGPVNPGDEGLACELRRAMHSDSNPRPVGSPWEIAVPTPEQILGPGIPIVAMEERDQ